MKYIFILLFSMGFVASSFGQNETKVWTLQECIDYALKNNLDLKQSELGVEMGQIDQKQAIFSQYPGVNASTGYQNSWGRSIDPTTNDFISIESSFLSSNASANAVLFNGFRIRNSIRQAQANVAASEMDYESTKDQVTLNVVTSYMGVIFSRELFENAQAQLRSTQEQVARTTKLVEVGSLPRSNLLELQAQEATNELNLVNQENSLNFSLLQLKQYLQLPSSTPLDVEIPDIDMMEILLSELNVDDIYQNSISSLAIVKKAEISVTSAEYGWMASKGNLYPRLSIAAGLNTNYSSFADRQRFVSDGGASTTIYPVIGNVDVNGSNYNVVSAYPQNIPSGEIVNGYSIGQQYQDNLNKFLSFNLSVPIFNGYTARLGVQRSYINVENQKIGLERTYNSLRQSIEQAYNDALAANKTYTSSQKQLNAREESFRVTEQRYRLGSADFTEYQIAENDLFRAKSDLLRAKYDLIYKIKVLDFYQGKPLSF